MQRNNNLSPLPWYRNIDEQNHFKSYAYGNVYPLYWPLGNVPAFQVIIPHGSVTVSDIQLVNCEDGRADEIMSDMTGLQIVRFSAYGYDVIVYPSTAPMGLTIKEGRYYMYMLLSDGTEYYSDIFTLVGDTSGFLTIQWWDDSDLIMDGCRIMYSTGYRNTLWLPTQLGKPDYEFEEEGETRDGYFFPEKMISEKKYKCVMLAPEYLCDVMRFIRLSDFVTVLDQNGVMYRCDTFLCTPKWQEQGDLASVEIEFTCDTVAKKVGRYIAEQPSFNNDFNNDFDN